MPTQDPTFRTDGTLKLIAVNESNRSLIFTPPELHYLTPPPRTWVENQWYPQSGRLDPNGTSANSGAAFFALIGDRSARQIAPDNRYAISNQIQGTPFRNYCEIVGTDGGSILRPGFGLFNLIQRPMEWTYIIPDSFTGRWGITIKNPGFATLVNLSIVYNPGQAIKNAWSQVAYHFQAQYFSPFYKGPAEQQDSSPLPFSTGSADESQEILSADGAYSMITAMPEPAI